MDYDLRKVLMILFIIVCFLSPSFISRVFSYDTNVAHPILTEKIAENYNNNFERKLTAEQINWLKQGSIEEDTPPRWLNHFFEPNREVGLGSFASAKYWAQSPNLQAIYLEILGRKGDQSWQKAIDSFARGDEKSAFIALGHTLHLIEDMSVPAHTRLDAHPEGDPYEKWAKENSSKEIRANNQVISANNLSEAFNKLAGYSNKYFFSKDTMDSNILKSSEEFKKKNGKIAVNCVKGDDILEQDICIAAYIISKFGKKNYYIDDPIVHSDYFSLLAPKAISYGSGAIKLFFDEADKKKQEQEQTSWWKKLKNWLNKNTQNFSSSLLNLTGDNAEQNLNNQGITINENALNNLVNQNNSSEEENQNQNSNEIISTKQDFEPQIQQENVPENQNNENNEQNENESNINTNQESSNSSNNGSQEQSQNNENSQNNEENQNEQNSQNNQNNQENESESAQNENSDLPANSTGGTNPQPQENNSLPDTTPPETSANSLLFSNNQTTATSTATFEFSSSEINSTFECSLDNASSTPCSSTKNYYNLSDGAHNFKVNAIDQVGNNDQTPAVFNWTIDATAPNISLELLNYDLMSIDFSVRWNSSSTDVSSYEIQYKINASGTWQDWTSSRTASQKSFQASYDNTIYYFRGRTEDSTGNQSAWQEISAEISLNPIAINEIAWMGTSAAFSSDEWIELFNKTSQEIDLTGWTLSSTDGTPNIALSGAISANGFYLLERTSNDSISDISADQIYTGAFSNTGEVLQLKDDSNNIIDSTPSGVWPAGEAAPGYKTMERINPLASGSASANWATNNGTRINGLASDGLTAINGTPKSQNSQFNSIFSASTTISDSTIISRDTIWTLKGSPYLLESNSGQYPILNAGIILIIEPGVIIKPQNKYYPSLIVKGTLLARGESSQQIKFTSKENSPQAGDWGAIIFESNSGDSILENVVFEYGGYKDDVKTCYLRSGVCQSLKGMAMIYDSALEIKNSTFQYSQYGGVWLSNSDANIEDCSFSDNQRDIIINGSGSQPTILNNILSNSSHSGIGIEISEQSAPDISSNNISGHSQAIYLKSAYPVFSTNVVSDNSYNGIYVDQQSVFSQNASWQNDLVYLLMSNSGDYPIIATGTILTIEPGVVLKSINKPYTALKVEGQLIAEGTGSQKIVFTAFNDDSFGGDSNNDAGAATPGSSGEWRNIVFVDGSRSSLAQINFKYGGYIPFPVSYDPNQTLDIQTGASVTQGDGVVVE